MLKRFIPILVFTLYPAMAGAQFLPPVGPAPSPAQEAIATLAPVVETLNFTERAHLADYAKVLAQVPTPRSTPVLVGLGEIMGPLSPPERQAVLQYLQGKVSECLAGIFGAQVPLPSGGFAPSRKCPQ